MDRTRRSLCGMGIASGTLAMVAPKLLSAAQEPAGGADPLLAYLAAETRRHSRGLSRPGAPRGAHMRALASNFGMLTAYMNSRLPLAEIDASIRRRIQEDGAGVFAQRARDAWPGHADDLARQFGVRVPRDLDDPNVPRAVDNLERHGCPRLGGVSRWLEAEAERIERLEGRVAMARPVRQTPGSDFGPPGWAIGTGDPGFTLGCSELAIILAAIELVLVFVPEVAPVFAQIAVILNMAMAVACAT
jgi:hypothetical protein